MKKVLIAVLIVLLLVLAYVAIFQGISIAGVKILSVGQIFEENDSLTNKISEANSLLKKEYPLKKEALLAEVSTLLEKEEYFSIAKVSTEGEITKANTEETYLIEYLWVRVGRYSRAKGVNVKMDFTSANTGEQNMQNLTFTVTGQYVGIIEFIYALENDSELNFKIENFKMIPSDTNLVATFNVRNVRINTEKITTTVEGQTENTENPNTKANTKTNTDDIANDVANEPNNNTNDNNTES